MATRTDPAAPGRRPDDDVIQLRAWGTDRAWRLADEPRWRIGAAPECTLRLDDAQGLVSRDHARLDRERDAWMLRDAGSKNGIRQDDARRLSFALTPGVEIGIGSLRLVAESARLIALRAYVQRLLGWGANRANEVDAALRRLRDHAIRRATLVIAGEGDLSLTARELHRRTLGSAARFVTAYARHDALDAAQAVVGEGPGTVCVWEARPPRGFAKPRARVENPRLDLRLIVCTHALGKLDAIAAQPLRIPPLADRADELDRIITASAADACADLAIDPRAFTAEDLAWIRARTRLTHPEIDRATLRLVALRATDGVMTHAALRLGISHVALSRWVARRRTIEP